MDKLRKRLENAYETARSFLRKRAQISKDRYDMKAKFVSLESGDVVLVRKMTHTGKYKILNR